MRIARWIPKATKAHSEYVIIIVFYCNIGYANPHQYYFVRTLAVLVIT
jgi:hypothetical protein